MKESKLELPVLHIYPTKWPHEELVIVGNKAGLARLAQAVSFQEVQGADCADGEYYDIIVIETSKEVLDQLPLPYTDEAFGQLLPDSEQRQAALAALVKAEFTPKTEPNMEG